MASEGTGSPGQGTSDLLRAGIDAAKMGQHTQARELLTQVVEQDERNVPAWLWLSGVVESLEERELCLENVLTLDPGNVAAQRGLAALRKRKPSHLLREGIAAAKGGDRQRARDLLTQVVDQDEGNVTAWLWLSGVVDNIEERQLCLENVLALDPTNEPARRGLAAIRAQRQEGEEPEILPEEEAPAPVPPTPEEKLGDGYPCPYCGAPTDPDDKKCPRCRNKLFVQERKNEKRSTWLWVGLTFQIFDSVVYLLVLFLVLAAVELEVDVNDPMMIVRAYLGLTGGIPPETVQAILDVASRVVFFAALIPAVLSSAIAIGIYLRWRPAYYVFLANAIYSVILIVASMLTVSGIQGCVGGGLIIPALLLIAAFQMRDDFAIEKKRILLRKDRDVSGGLALLARGRQYIRQKMWAMAALHLERAIGQVSQEHKMDGYIMLGLTYVHMGRYKRAAETIAEANRLDPQDARIEELEAFLEEERAAAAG